jgi:precorrin-6Y C5,15-methyltransferase (decarboxylating)
MKARIPIIGIGPDGLAGLSPRSRELLLQAEVVVGSEGALRLVPELEAERLVLGTDLTGAVDQMRRWFGQRKMVVIAVGDPLFYGTARYLCDKFGADAFDVIPHVSSMQLAFARIKQSWEEAYLTDLAVRPLEEVLDKIRTSQTVGLFTTEHITPGRIARELLAHGIDYFTVWVCENLGGKDERITQGELQEICELSFHPLNIVILKRKPGRPDRPRPTGRLRRFGNPDDVFAQSLPKSGLITQAEVRAVALAQLDLHPGDIFWDVGAGSGSVAIEAAGLVYPGTSYAIEQDAADYHLIVANAETFGVTNVRPVFGTAPEVFARLPIPDAIFVGGNGGEVARLLDACYTALRSGGRLVTNVGTLEMIGASYQVLKRLAGQVEVLLMHVARGVEQLDSLRFEAVNPTVLLRALKP